MKGMKCQCCFTNIIYNDTNSDYDIAQNTYSELIKETFNIIVSTEINNICNQCLMKLQEASDFKNIILIAQNELKSISYDVQNTQINETKNDENIKIDDNTWDIDKDSIISNMESIESDEFKLRKSLKDDRVKEINDETCKSKDNSPPFPHEGRTKIQKEIREDSIKLLKYSNICLFKSLKTKFQCNNCKEAFNYMKDLRLHTETHNHTNKYQKVNLKGYSFKNADISSLNCKLCQQSCEDLNILRRHLESRHGVKFWTNKHMFITYKLNYGYQCLICKTNFNNFVRLSSHMNSHSTNNVCEICGQFFINRLTLRTHLQIHKEKKCTICKARFEKSYAKAKHMQTVHNIGSVKRYCSLCCKVFKHSYMLIEHRIKEHGIKREVSKCLECNKTFLSSQNLKIHQRSVHFKERNYPCNVCGMRFFTKADEKRHGRKHDDVKSFSCSYCEGKFKSKDSWRRHLKRIHDNIVD